jgi:hypothetical protein
MDKVARAPKNDAGPSTLEMVPPTSFFSQNQHGQNGGSTSGLATGLSSTGINVAMPPMADKAAGHQTNSNSQSIPRVPITAIAANSNTVNNANVTISKNIQEAASRYDSAKSTYTTNANANNPESKNDFMKENTWELSSRTKSIAEKLGFMNFEDDQFDKPSYQRKEPRNPSEDQSI